MSPNPSSPHSDHCEAASGLREGDVLAGKYRIDRILGVGGMGVVVAAHHVGLDERVAIKFMLPAALGVREAVDRFAREARAAVKIKSEHVARVSDVGVLANGAPYMVMEYLEGSDLAAWLETRGVLPVEQAVEFVLQACEAIAEAHALGIVHRDLKPANLFVVRGTDGMLSVKVLDFGISKMTRFASANTPDSITKTSALMGSPLYMPPEQMQSAKDADARSDIWALGAILYQLLAGETPFIGESMPELILQILNAAPRPLRRGEAGELEGIEPVIRRCLEKDRALRFQTVGELAAALLPFGPRRSKSSVARIVGVMQAAGMSESALALPPSSAEKDASPSPATPTVGAFGGTLPGRPDAWRKWLFAGVLVVGALAGTAFAFRRATEAARVEVSTAAEVRTVPTAAPKDEMEGPVAPPPEPLPSVTSLLVPALRQAPMRSGRAAIRPPATRTPATVPSAIDFPGLPPSNAPVSEPTVRTRPVAAPVPPKPAALPNAPGQGRRLGGRI